MHKILFLFLLHYLYTKMNKRESEFKFIYFKSSKIIWEQNYYYQLYFQW